MRDMNRLFNHPTTPTPAIHRFEADARRLADGSLAFIYELRGELSTLQIPPRRDDSRVDGLWQHSCFEAFVAVQGETAYREFNFSPSGRWAVYDFGDYRRRLSDPALATPRITTRLTEGRFELEVVIPLSSLPFAPAGKCWEIGLAAVIEATDTLNDGLSYWALRHPSPRPDFHLRNGFALRHPPLSEYL